MLRAIHRRNKEQQDGVPVQFEKRAAAVRVYINRLEKMAPATLPAEQSPVFFA
jgi:hypothetical protein